VDPEERAAEVDMFQDRRDAGLRLAKKLEDFRAQKPLVLAIPRGGVEVGYEVAKRLKADFSVLISRKLPFPTDPEAGFGAIAEDGSTFLEGDARRWVSEDEIEQIKDEQTEEIQRRLQVFRGGKPLPEIAGRTVILVDDGLAMGSTMKAALLLCRHRNAARVVVAVPVSGSRVAQEIREMADEAVILEVPESFQAVAQVYAHWRDLTDEETLAVLDRWRSESKAAKKITIPRTPPKQNRRAKKTIRPRSDTGSSTSQA
jgi:putative phosphoribosyl transferase